MSAMSQGMLTTYGKDVVVSWLQEFGYLYLANTEAAIHAAMTERGVRWKLELLAHAEHRQYRKED